MADFDKYVELKPDAESRQWERGISYYYAGEFAKGAKQFELYQTYHDQDVENSVWRYLCVAREGGVEKAQANMLPIENDRRIPMMQSTTSIAGRKSRRTSSKWPKPAAAADRAQHAALLHAPLSRPLARSGRPGGRGEETHHRSREAQDRPLHVGRSPRPRRAAESGRKEIERRNTDSTDEAEGRGSRMKGRQLDSLGFERGSDE